MSTTPAGQPHRLLFITASLGGGGAERALVNIINHLDRSRFQPVINEQTVPQSSLRSDSRRRLLWPIAGQLYRRASHIIAISQGIAAELERNLHIATNRISVIHNPIPLAQVIEQAHYPVNFRVPHVPAVLAVGRLVPLKNYPLLLPLLRTWHLPWAFQHMFTY
jgi:glycosyltransferase involved in cell wall biosynthesis